MRISLSKYNIQRVESLMHLIVDDLKHLYSRKLIKDFLRTSVILANTFDDEIVPIGGLIDQHDDIKDIFTPACKDGTTITPGSIKAVIVTIPTRYEPSGQKQIEILPGFVESLTPKFRHIIDYSGFFLKDSLEKRIESKQVMLERIVTYDNKDYHLDNSCEDILLSLAREVASIGRLVIDLSSLYSHPKTISKPEHLKNEFLETVSSVYLERRKYSNRILTMFKSILNGKNITNNDREKLTFYQHLTEIYIKKMDFLTELIEKKTPIDHISMVADLLCQLGVKDIDKIDTIIQGLKNNNFNAIEKCFNYVKLGEESIPDWYKEAEYLCDQLT